MPEKPALRPDLVADARAETERIKGMQPVIVTNPEEMPAAQEFIRDVATDKRRLEDHRKAEKSFWLDGGRLVDSLFKPAIDHLDRIEAETKRSVLAFQRAQEKAAREAEAREQAAAEERRLALLAEAEAAEDAGNHGDARWLRADAHLQAAPVLPMVAPLTEGISKRVVWHAEIVDFVALLKAAGEHPGLYASFLSANLQALNAAARTQGDALRIPGVKAVAEETLAARSR